MAVTEFKIHRGCARAQKLRQWGVEAGRTGGGAGKHFLFPPAACSHMLITGEKQSRRSKDLRRKGRRSPMPERERGPQNPVFWSLERIEDSVEGYVWMQVLFLPGRKS